LLSSLDAMPPGWEAAFEAVDRAWFLPDRVWAFDDDAGVYTCVIDRLADPEAWHRYAQANVALVTRWDDGAHTGDDPGRVATSSASMPSIVADMLHELAVTGREKVLEIGTGTGYTAALLAARGCRVTTIEIDPEVAEQARKNLAAAGFPDVAVVTGDGALGYAEGGPWDRVHVTAGVRRTPPAWLEQTRPGGLVVMPWGTYYAHSDRIAVLSVRDARHASGPFTEPVGFMKLRAQRARWPNTSFPDGWMVDARASRPDIDIADITGPEYGTVEFILGLHVPDCIPQVVETAEGVNLWLYGADTGDGESIAVAAFADGYDPQALQAGARDLWDEVQAAYHRWDDAGRPDADRFGLSVVVDADGVVEQRGWYRSPDNELRTVG